MAGTKKRAGFFHIDRRTWAAVCDLGNLNAAVAYVTLASGTGEGNDITKWSAKALRTHMGMRLESARGAIDLLLQKGLLALGPEHSRAKPRFHLKPWSEPVAGKVKPAVFAGPLTAPEETVNRIWLPNSLIVNPAGGPAPIHGLRMAGDLWALRLLVDLYHAHLLDSDGGVSTKFIRTKYERILIGQQGQYTVWGFKVASSSLHFFGPFKAHEKRKEEAVDSPVWDTLHRLTRMGLISYVPHLFPNDALETEPVHSLGGPWCKGEPEEDAMRSAAYNAATWMVQAGQMDAAEAAGFGTIAVPVPSYLDKAEVRGVLRLVFKPHTSATAKWLEGLRSFSPVWVERYEKLKQKGAGAAEAVREWEAWGT